MPKTDVTIEPRSIKEEDETRKLRERQLFKDQKKATANSVISEYLDAYCRIRLPHSNFSLITGYLD